MLIAGFTSRMFLTLFIHSHGNAIYIWKKQLSRVTSRDVKQGNKQTSWLRLINLNLLQRFVF